MIRKQQWSDLNNVQLIFADYRSLLWLTGSLLIKYCFASLLGHLILHQDSLNIRLFSSYPSIHFHTHTHTISQLDHLYIYLSDYQVGSNNWQTIITTVGWKWLNIKLQTNKSLYWPTLHGELCSENNSCVNRLGSVNTANSVTILQSPGELGKHWVFVDDRVNSVETIFSMIPSMTEWVRWKLPFGDWMKLS